MAGGWGAPINQAMTTGEEPYIPGRFLPEMAEIIPMQDASVSTIRRQGTLAKAMPPVSDIDVGKFSNANWRAIEAEQFAQAMKQSFDITKAYDRRMRKVADAKDKQTQKAAENFGKRIKAGMGPSSRNKARTKALARRNAQPGWFAEARHVMFPV